MLGKVNGCAGDTDGEETGVIVEALLLLSTKRLDWNVSKEYEPALNASDVLAGDVGGVKTAVPSVVLDVEYAVGMPPLLTL